MSNLLSNILVNFLTVCLVLLVWMHHVNSKSVTFNVLGEQEEETANQLDQVIVEDLHDPDASPRIR